MILGDDSARLPARSGKVEGLGFAVKTGSTFPGNAARGLPSIHGAVPLFDADCQQTPAVNIAQRGPAGVKISGPRALAAMERLPPQEPRRNQDAFV